VTCDAIVSDAVVMMDELFGYGSIDRWMDIRDDVDDVDEGDEGEEGDVQCAEEMR